MRSLVALLAIATPGVLPAQAPLRALERAGIGALTAFDSGSSFTEPPASVRLPPAAFPRRDVWWAPIASALVPGSGQMLLRQDRALAYVALESFFIVRYLRDRDEARRQREAYRALARNVARAFFGDGLVDGDFEYYERMRKWTESGVYDLVPGGDVDPETDESTFNGSVWRLARETFWEDPLLPPDDQSIEYRRALTFYQSRAVPPQFRWSWRNAQLEQDLFIRTIDASNGAFRRSISELGILLANHALSTVDAYVTVRLRLRVNESASPDGSDAGSDAGIVASIPWAPFGRR